MTFWLHSFFPLARIAPPIRLLALDMTKLIISGGPASDIEIENDIGGSMEEIIGNVDGKAQLSSAQLSSLRDSN